MLCVGYSHENLKVFVADVTGQGDVARAVAVAFNRS